MSHPIPVVRKFIVRRTVGLEWKLSDSFLQCEIVTFRLKAFSLRERGHFSLLWFNHWLKLFLGAPIYIPMSIMHSPKGRQRKAICQYCESIGHQFIAKSRSIVSIQLKDLYSLQVVFEGVIGASYNGDIAIDDISLTSGACPSKGKSYLSSINCFSFSLWSRNSNLVALAVNQVSSVLFSSKFNWDLQNITTKYCTRQKCRELENTLQQRVIGQEPVGWDVSTLSYKW